MLATHRPQATAKTKVSAGVSVGAESAPPWLARWALSARAMVAAVGVGASGSGTGGLGNWASGENGKRGVPRVNPGPGHLSTRVRSLQAQAQTTRAVSEGWWAGQRPPRRRARR